MTVWKNEWLREAPRETWCHCFGFADLLLGSAFAFESGTVGIVFSRDPNFQLVSMLKYLDLDSKIGEISL